MSSLRPVRSMSPMGPMSHMSHMHDGLRGLPGIKGQGQTLGVQLPGLILTSSLSHPPTERAGRAAKTRQKQSAMSGCGIQPVQAGSGRSPTVALQVKTLLTSS